MICARRRSRRLTAKACQLSSIIHCFDRTTLLPEHLPLATPGPSGCSNGGGAAQLAISPLTSLLAYGGPVRAAYRCRCSPSTVRAAFLVTSPYPCLAG